MPFTPVQTFLGGLLLHLSTSSLLTDTGRIFGVSSLIDGAFWGDHARWRWAVLAGLVSGPALIAATGLASAIPDPGTAVWAAQPIGRLALAGALVGFGSKVGSSPLTCARRGVSELRPWRYAWARLCHGHSDSGDRDWRLRGLGSDSGRQVDGPQTMSCCSLDQLTIPRIM